MKILTLSCESLTKEFNEELGDEGLLRDELLKNGHTVETIPWTADAPWSEYDCVIIRTTWDYMLTPHQFLQKLELISSQTTLLNSYETVKWNIHKGHLKSLEKKGVTIIPTLMFRHDEELKIPSDWGMDKFIIKPAISASAYKTTIVDRQDIEGETYRSSLIPGDWLCQPFVPQITDGEISLVYFNKKFSHALLKIPAPGDFRVQIEWGGSIEIHQPDEKLLQFGDKIVNSVEEDLLYARVDVVPFKNDYALMELELIEPALYLRTHADAPKNFLKALIDVQKK